MGLSPAPQTLQIIRSYLKQLVFRKLKIILKIIWEIYPFFTHRLFEKCISLCEWGFDWF